MKKSFKRVCCALLCVMLAAAIVTGCKAAEGLTSALSAKTESIIEDALSQTESGTAAQRDAEGEAKQDTDLTIHCQNALGEAVAGCSVKCCVGDACMLCATDGNGDAVFHGVEGSIEFDVVSTPSAFPYVGEPVIAESGLIVYTLYASAEEAPADVTVYLPGAHLADGFASAGKYADADLLAELDLTGVKLIMVNYWEPWCNPCISEMPAFEALYQKYKDRGLLIVGIYSYQENAQEMMEETGVTYPCVFSGSTSVYASEAVPDTLFMTTDFQLLPPDAEELADAITESVTAFIDAMLAGNYDAYADMPEYKDWYAENHAWAERMQSDPAALKEELLKTAQEEVEAYPYGFCGSESYEMWEKRILTRLGE